MVFSIVETFNWIVWLEAYQAQYEPSNVVKSPNFNEAVQIYVDPCRFPFFSGEKRGRQIAAAAFGPINMYTSAFVNAQLRPSRRSFAFINFVERDLFIRRIVGDPIHHRA